MDSLTQHRFDLNRVSIDIPYMTRASFNAKGTVLRALLGRVQTVHQIRALDDVSLSIRGGEHVGVIGSNGAGKTTLIRALGGMLEPNAGVLKRPREVQALIGDSSLGLDPDESGLENFDRLLAMRKVGRRIRRELEEEAIRLMSLGSAINRPVSTYSSGMCARVRVATLVLGPSSSLVLDEVIGTADYEFTSRVKHLMMKKISQSPILVIASHDFSLIRQLTRRCIWLEHGKVRSDGPTEEVVAAYLKSVDQGVNATC